MRRLRHLKTRTDGVALPKGAVVLLCASILALPAGLAIAHNPKLDSGGGWQHAHTTSYTSCNYVDQNSDLKTQVGNARTNWFQSTYAPELISMPHQNDCHPGAGAQTYIQHQDAYYGNTGWRASSQDEQGANAYSHFRHAHINYNLSASWSGYTGYERRALVCKEIGQVIGVERVFSAEWASHGDDNDCMSFGGSPSGQVSKAENASNYTYTDRPGPHSKTLLDPRYADEGPDVTLSGTLADAAAAREILDDASYSLTIQATGLADGYASINRIEVRIDGGLVWSQSCGGVAQCTRTWILEPWQSILALGGHEIEAKAIDQAGFAKSEKLAFYLPDRSGAGQLDTATYIDTELAGGGQARVNVASGNALVEAPDFTAQDGMPTGEIVRYYNSVRAGEPGALGPGWRLGIGEDVKLVGGGHESLIWHTPSGARALFVPSGGCSFRGSLGTSAKLTQIPASGGNPTYYEIFVPEWGETWVFDAQGRLTEIRSSTGPVRLSYDAQGGLDTLSFEDGGGTITVQRNATGQISQLTRAGEALPIAQYSYENGRLASHTGPGGRLTTYTYDQGGALNGVADSGGESSEVEIQHGQAEAVDADAAAPGDTEFSYDPSSGGVDPGSTQVIETTQATTYSIDPANEVRAASQGSSPPAMTLETNLPDDTSEPVDVAEPVVLDIDATSGSGVEWAGIVVDGALETELIPACAAPPCPSVAESVTFDPLDMEPGDYSGQAVVVDSDGDVRQEDFSFRIPEEPGCGSESTEWEAPAPHEPTTEELSYAQEFREDHNLPATTSHVTASFTEPQQVDAELRWGLPLTRSEEDELEFRSNELEDAMGVIEDYGASAPSSYAGMYVDQSAGGIATALFTTNLAQHEQALQAAFAYATRLAVRPAEHSLAALDGVAAEIDADRAVLRTQHVAVEGADVGLMDNRLYVDITEPTTSGENSDLLPLPEAQDVLTGRYGSAVVAEYAVSEDYGQRFQGGRLIFRFEGEIGHPECTSAFGTARTVETPAGDRRRYGILTAGHCAGNANDLWHGVWRCDSGGCSDRRIGRPDPNPFERREVDAMSIRISFGSGRRRVPTAIYTGLGHLAPVVGAMGKRPVEGTTACIVYRQSNIARCGEVSDSHAGGTNSSWGTDGKFIHVKHEECCGRLGDSGGAVYRPRNGTAHVIGVFKGKIEADGGGLRALVEPWSHIKNYYPKLGVKQRHSYQEFVP